MSSKTGTPPERRRAARLARELYGPTLGATRGANRSAAMREYADLTDAERDFTRDQLGYLQIRATGELEQAVRENTAALQALLNELLAEEEPEPRRARPKTRSSSRKRAPADDDDADDDDADDDDDDDDDDAPGPAPTAAKLPPLPMKGTRSTSMDVLRHACETCGAVAGEECVTSSGGNAKGPHAARMRAAGIGTAPPASIAKDPEVLDVDGKPL